jgi:hypothetical protein
MLDHQPDPMTLTLSRNQFAMALQPPLLFFGDTRGASSPTVDPTSEYPHGSIVLFGKSQRLESLNTEFVSLDDCAKGRFINEDQYADSDHNFDLLDAFAPGDRNDHGREAIAGDIT